MNLVLIIILLSIVIVIFILGIIKINSTHRRGLEKYVIKQITDVNHEDFSNIKSLKDLIFNLNFSAPAHRILTMIEVKDYKDSKDKIYFLYFKRKT